MIVDSSAVVAVFLKEYSEQQERLDKEERLQQGREERAWGLRLPLPWG